MKSSLKVLFSSLLLISLMLSSCTKDTLEVEKVPEKISEETPIPALQTDAEIAEWLNGLENTSTEVNVEHATLEEINAIMIENGLSPYTERDVEKARDLVSRMTWPCATWTILGDWNDSGTVTAFDMVLARIYVCNNVGCGQTLVTSGHPLNVRFFGFLSFLENGTESSFLNENDMMAAAYFILGITACN